MISKHATPNLFAAYVAFHRLERKTSVGCYDEAALADLQRIDCLWATLLEIGELRQFFTEDARTTTANGGYDCDIDYPAIHFLLWRYKRDRLNAERWRNFRETWRNLKASGLDVFFEEDLCVTRANNEK